MKICPKCGLNKYILEFSKNKASKDGLRCYCKQCCRQYYLDHEDEFIQYRLDHRDEITQYNIQYRLDHKEELIQYRLDHKDEIAQYQAQYRLDHGDEIAQYRLDHTEYQVQYYLDHRDEILQRQTQYDLNHKDEKMQYQAQYYLDHEEEFIQYRLDHKDKITQYNTQYRLDHKEERAQYRIKYRLEHPEDCLTLSIRTFCSFVCKSYILERDNYCCQLCKSNKNLISHHILPIKEDSKKEHILNPKNLVILCETCHMKAHDGAFKRVNVKIAKHLLQLVRLKEVAMKTILPKFI